MLTTLSTGIIQANFHQHTWKIIWHFSIVQQLKLNFPTKCPASNNRKKNIIIWKKIEIRFFNIEGELTPASHDKINRPHSFASPIHVSIAHSRFNRPQLFQSPTVVSIAHSCFNRPQSFKSPTVVSIAHSCFNRAQLFQSPTDVSIAHSRFNRPQSFQSPTVV